MTCKKFNSLITLELKRGQIRRTVWRKHRERLYLGRIVCKKEIGKPPRRWETPERQMNTWPGLTIALELNRKTPKRQMKIWPELSMNVSSWRRETPNQQMKIWSGIAIMSRLKEGRRQSSRWKSGRSCQKWFGFEKSSSSSLRCSRNMLR